VSASQKACAAAWDAYHAMVVKEGIELLMRYVGKANAMTDDNDLLAAVIDAGHCPDCNHRGFLLGPRAGVTLNIECGNRQCRARFNVTAGLESHHIIFAERIPKQSEGGPDWW
jgi:hypothetical protein